MNGLSSAEWRSDTHHADRINELEARVKELEDALRKCDNADSFGQINTIVFVALKKEKPNGN